LHPSGFCDLVIWPIQAYIRPHGGNVRNVITPEFRYLICHAKWYGRVSNGIIWPRIGSWSAFLWTR